MPTNDLCASALGPARIVEASDPDYPSELRDLASPPARIFVVGPIGALGRAVAIVGTRRASRDGRQLARQIAGALTSEDCLVISGAAEGIDGEAHLGALDVPGPTLAVIATPLDAPYPRVHVPLLEAVLSAGGAVVSETAPGEPTYLGSFLRRNRLVAALARAVIVIEAPARSGTLSTVKHAQSLSRPVFAVPWSPLEPLRAGGVALLGRGAARAVRDAPDVLDALGWPRRRVENTSTRRFRPEAPHADSASAKVLTALADGASFVDAIVRVTGLEASVVSTVLFSLVLDGAVVEAGGHHRLAR